MGDVVFSSYPMKNRHVKKKLLDLTNKVFSIHGVDAQVCGNPSAGVC